MQKNRFGFFSKHGLYGLSFILFWCFFYFPLAETLGFLEKNQLFRFSADYWHLFDHKAGQVLFYLNAFFIQFNYYPALGAAVFSLLFCLLTLSVNSLLQHIARRRFFAPGFAFSGLLLSTVPFYGLIWVLLWLSVIGGALLVQAAEQKKLRYGLQAAVLLLLVGILREYALLAWIFYIVVEICRLKSTRQRITLSIFLPGLFSLGIGIGLGQRIHAPFPFIDTESMFLLLRKGAFRLFDEPAAYFPTVPGFSVFLRILNAALILSPLLLPLCKKFADQFEFSLHSIPFKYTRTGLCVLLALAGGLIGYRQAIPIQRFHHVDTLCRQYRWEEALQLLDRQWNLQTERPRLSHSFSLFCAQTKVALLATRKATDRLFTYPQPDFPILFPIELVNRAESFVLPSYYMYTGGFGESLHLNYDFITKQSISANIVKGVIANSLIMDDSLPAVKFIHLLDQSLFYRRQATCYAERECYAGLPEIARGKKMLPRHDYTVKAYHPDENAMNEYRNNPENPYFYEYYLCLCLLKKQHRIIVDEMPKIRRFYYRGKGIFFAPRHLQEAFLANFDYSPIRMEYPPRIEGISREVWNDYWQFIADNNAWKRGTMTFGQLQKKWKHTYWFYDCYLSIVRTGSSASHAVN